MILRHQLAVLQRRQPRRPHLNWADRALLAALLLATDTVPSRPDRLATLGNPVLTGMSRPALAKLIERLATQQAAQAQRRNHRRRGGDRQSGARAGIFCEKITDAERVLAVILGLRKICTWEIVAELFEVSRRTIGNASAWVRPLLDQEQRTVSRSATATRARRRYSPLSQDTKTHRPSPKHHFESLRLHYHRNLLTLVPKTAQPWVSTLVRTIFEQPDAASVRAQHAQVTAALEAKPPAAAAHLDAARDDILAFAVFPREVWRQVWSNNPQEQLNKEVRRRTDVVGIFPGREAIIRLVGAVLAEQNDEWTESRRYTGLEILAACRKAAQPDMGQNIASEARLTIEAIPA